METALRESAGPGWKVALGGSGLKVAPLIFTTAAFSLSSVKNNEDLISK